MTPAINTTKSFNDQKETVCILGNKTHLISQTRERLEKLARELLKNSGKALFQEGFENISKKEIRFLKKEIEKYKLHTNFLEENFFENPAELNAIEEIRKKIKILEGCLSRKNKNFHPQPFIYLKTYKQINKFLNGEVEITHENYNDLMEAARKLNVRGLVKELSLFKLNILNTELEKIKTEGEHGDRRRIFSDLINEKGFIFDQHLPLEATLACDKLISRYMCLFPEEIESEILPKLENLYLLDLSENGNFFRDDLVIKIIEKNPKLLSLNLSGCVNLTGKIMQAIIKYPKLRILNLGGCTNITKESTTLTGLFNSKENN